MLSKWNTAGSAERLLRGVVHGSTVRLACQKKKRRRAQRSSRAAVDSAIHFPVGRGEYVAMDVIDRSTCLTCAVTACGFPRASESGDCDGRVQLFKRSACTVNVTM